MKIIILITALTLSSCSSYYSGGLFEQKDSGPDRHVDVHSIPDATPRAEPKSRSGNRASYTVLGKQYHVMSSAAGFSERGIASWYGNKFHGRATASGEPYDMYAMTAAHKSLPLPTYVQVTNLENNRQVIVKVNDRGPFHKNRIIDLSYVAAAKLGITGKGTGLVEIRAIDPNRPEKQTPAKIVKHNKNAIYIQAGAFTNRDNALRLQGKLQHSLETNVRIAKNELDGTLFYRVQIGPLYQIENADTISEQLENMGMANLKIVID